MDPDTFHDFETANVGVWKSYKNNFVFFKDRHFRAQQNKLSLKHIVRPK